VEILAGTAMPRRYRALAVDGVQTRATAIWPQKIISVTPRLRG